jgi:predicted aspartyl protease
MTLEIDTGAEPMLVTSMAWIDHVVPSEELRERGHVVTMADGRAADAILSYFEIEWFGRAKLVEVLAPTVGSGFLAPGRQGRAPNGLLGRNMLAGCRLTIDYAQRTVTIEPSEGLPL